MKLSELKNHLGQAETIAFQLPNGTLVPRHFHVTEVGKVSKHFIDCGGTIRTEEVANIQLWEANDYDHRLHPEKLTNIIELSEQVLGLNDLDIEVEYQGDTIGKFGLDYAHGVFLLTNTQTACLATDACGIPAQEEKIPVSSNTCTPGSGCC